MIPNKKLLNFKCSTWQDKQIQQQNKNTLSYVFLSPCHLITISSIEHKNRPITGKNPRLALKYGTLHKDTHLLLLLILSRQCLLADEIFFTPSSAKRKKKKVNILRNIIQELKANTWNKRRARETRVTKLRFVSAFHLIGWENGAVIFSNQSQIAVK